MRAVRLEVKGKPLKRQAFSGGPLPKGGAEIISDIISGADKEKARQRMPAGFSVRDANENDVPKIDPL